MIGGIACVFIGISAKTFFDKTLTTNHTPANITKSALAASEKIAVVNLDAGIQKANKTVYYANKIIEYPSSNYQTTSLEEAKTGVEKGRYAAYVIIPSSFSESVNSINTTPKQAVFEYQINSYLDSDKREQMIYEILNFEQSINSSISYIYIDAILNEVHSLQDNSTAIMGNDKNDLQAVQSIQAESLIEPVSFSEMKVKDDPIKDVSLTKQEKNMVSAVTSIHKNYQTALTNGKNAYKILVLNRGKVKDSLDLLQTQVDGFNAFTDTKGNSYITSGLESLKNEVQTSNTEIFNKRTQLNESIAGEVNQSINDNQQIMDNERKEVQNSIDTKVVSDLQGTLDGYLKDSNQKIGNYLQEQNTTISSQISQYTASLQKYLEQSMCSDDAKAVIKNIAMVHAEEAFQTASKSETEYLQNQADREAAQKYNESIDVMNQKIGELQTALQELDKAIGILNGTYEEPVKSEEPTITEEPTKLEEPTVTDGLSPSPGDMVEEVTAKYNVLKGKVSAICQFEKQTMPEEMAKPDIHAVIDQSSIDTSPLLPFVNIGQASDTSGNAITQPSVKLEIAPLGYKLRKDSITYKVPMLSLSNVTNINADTLRKIEGYYMLPTDRFHEVVQKKLVNQIESRNTVLQGEVSKKMKSFTTEQSAYQSSLDEFDPFSYVDKESMKADTDSIVSNMSDIVTEVNNTSIGYRDYVTDVISLAEDNINTLQGDMNRASDKTKKNVLNQINAMKARRQQNSNINISLLQAFAGKLSFTRVGNLPHREAYQFIVNPIKCQDKESFGG